MPNTNFCISNTKLNTNFCILNTKHLWTRVQVFDIEILISQTSNLFGSILGKNMTTIKS
jgi:hypothetical protein